MSETVKRVAIVDDSPLMRQILTTILRESGKFDIVGTAADPIEARQLIRETNPDVITLDVEMPKMDGLTFLEKIMRLKPTPVVMISSLTTEGADVTLRALELGAIDCIAKPTQAAQQAFDRARDQLVEIVYTAASARVTTSRTTAKAPAVALQRSSVITTQPQQKKIDIIGIGASTGGVTAIHDVINQLPKGLPPITIVQHMPPSFIERFTERLNELSIIDVKLPTQGEILRRGHAYVAPADCHLALKKVGEHYSANLVAGRNVSGHKPSADVMFQSIADYAGGNSMGIILTGMGRDGADGLLAMRQKGGLIIGQNQESSTVYGMNKAAFDNGAVQKQLDIKLIANAMLSKL